MTKNKNIKSGANKEIAETPLMKQYNSIKAKYPDALLLFRVGDFYETFSEDAIKASKILGIVLTKRANGSASHIELAGFPHHALDTYLPKLVRAGMRVAICDQLEDPKATKTIVKRGVTDIVTPGMTFSDKILDHKENNFLAVIHFSSDSIGVAFSDISTGEFLVSQGSAEYIDRLLQNYGPNEIVLAKGKTKQFEEVFESDYYIYETEAWPFQETYAKEQLTRHFNTQTLKGFGIEELVQGTIAAGVLLHYLNQHKQDQLKHINSLKRIDANEFVWLDRFTIRNLELIVSHQSNSETLFSIMDHTTTPMGSRMLRQWICMPLKNLQHIRERHEAVNYFKSNDTFRNKFADTLLAVGDIERLASKLAVGRISPREVKNLQGALENIKPIKEFCQQTKVSSLIHRSNSLDNCDDLIVKVKHAISDDAPAVMGKGQTIRTGFDDELDELREIARSGKDFLINIQKRESESTGINSLKVGFNNVFGYYIEVTHTHKDKVPDSWIRKQTLVNSERYITPEIKEYEEKIFGAEDKIALLETQLYQILLQTISAWIEVIQRNAFVLAELDCLCGFGKLAEENNYCLPELNDGLRIEIENGRHPVLEKCMPPGEMYISNDVILDPSEEQIMIITGPNMAGKSALLRQTALICLMAQCGSFIPATSARIGLIDKIFTRVGANDNISGHESTFMVEMNETASILNNLSERSLILLDEIGRGTSTYDGISIAWAITEYIHNHQFKAKTMFATHYHELNEMENVFDRIKNYNVSIKETENNILFLRKLKKGGIEHSFGIHVARMAGMPQLVLNKANKILKELESKRSDSDEIKNSLKQITSDLQLSIFNLDDPLLIQIKDEILKTDIDTLTPVEALMKLHEIKKLLVGKREKHHH